MSDIYLVSPPFRPIDCPSSGIGQLIAAAKYAGLDAKAVYLSVRFAHKIGFSLYSFIAGYLHSEMLFGEWVFSKVAFEEFQIPWEEYPLHTITDDLILKAFVTEFYAKKQSFFWETFDKLPQLAKHFIEDSAREIVENQPMIVGCSTLYQQTNASLALLRHIKRFNPNIVTIIGGLNCEAEIGYILLKNCEWIDFVVSGEADSLFPKLCREIYECGADIPIERLPYGVYSRPKLSVTLQNSKDGFRGVAETALELDMDDIPVPDFSDYFAELSRTGLTQEVKPTLTMETSRGCWKGFREPCNFCGLNRVRYTYRRKSPARVLHELAQLAETYAMRKFRTTDCILSMGYFNTLFKILAQQQAPYELSFETSSSLNERQVKLLADAGVTWIQAGIESVHDELLKLLNKGNSAIHNIALLKYALENGITVCWSLLVDIPGDDDTYYQEMVEVLPLLYHLQPPHLAPIRFDRFSQYFEKSEQFGLTLVPGHYYQYVYPFNHDDLKDFAYFLEDATTSDNGQRPLKAGRKKINTLVYKEWRRAFYGTPKAKLLMSETEERTVITDSRPCAVAPEFTLSGIEHFIYKECRRPVLETTLYSLLCRIDQKKSIDKQTLEQALQQLLKKKLLLCMSGKYLALATRQMKRAGTILPGCFDLFLIKSFQKQTIPKRETSAIWEWFASLRNE